MFTVADRDKDGKISYQEFLVIMIFHFCFLFSYFIHIIFIILLKIHHIFTSIAVREIIINPNEKCNKY